MSNERGGGAKVNPDDRRSGCRTGDDEYPSPSHQRNTGTGDDEQKWMGQMEERQRAKEAKTVPLHCFMN
jgi:hypothetical protein